MKKNSIDCHTTVRQKAEKKLDGLDLKEKDIQGNRGKYWKISQILARFYTKVNTNNWVESMVPRYFKLFWAWAGLSPIFVSNRHVWFAICNLQIKTN